MKNYKLNKEKILNHLILDTIVVIGIVSLFLFRFLLDSSIYGVIFGVVYTVFSGVMVSRIHKNIIYPIGEDSFILRKYDEYK